MFLDEEKCCSHELVHTPEVHEERSIHLLPLLALLPRMGAREDGSQEMDDHKPTPLTYPQNSRRKLVDLLLSGMIGRTGARYVCNHGRNDPRREV